MGWKEKHISKAGREVLIKTMAQAIPTYSMSLFKIPKAICDGINKLWYKKFIGLTRISFVPPRTKVALDSGTFMLST